MGLVDSVIGVPQLYGGAELHKMLTGTQPGDVRRETDMPFYEKGDVRIRYEEAGTGFPLLVIPGGGLNSRISNWPNAVFNSIDRKSVV